MCARTNVPHRSIVPENGRWSTCALLALISEGCAQDTSHHPHGSPLLPFHNTLAHAHLPLVVAPRCWFITLIACGATRALRDVGLARMRRGRFIHPITSTPTPNTSSNTSQARGIPGSEGVPAREHMCCMPTYMRGCPWAACARSIRTRLLGPHVSASPKPVAAAAAAERAR